MNEVGIMWETLQQNLTFVFVSAVIAAAIALLAKFSERYFKELHKVGRSRRICIIAICGAIAAVLHIMDFPLLFLAPEFYKLDFSELPVMLCGFYLGPSAAVFCEVIKILLKLLLKGTSTAFVGDFANFVVGCSLVLPASIIYHTRKSRNSALFGSIVGTLVLTFIGSLFNAVYLLPKFSQLYGIPMDAIIAMGASINGGITNVYSFVMLAVAPLNLIKGTMISTLTMLLYKKVARPLFGRNV
ncbi:MAG: ECF transporter S component [Oscillospiraceae bacterium]|nr:ECF transporter S component [Oscillospiraceae bacterium]